MVCFPRPPRERLMFFFQEMNTSSAELARASCRLGLLQNAPGNDQPLDLARPIENSKRPGVPKQALHCGAADHTETAKNLQGLVDDLESQ